VEETSENREETFNIPHAFRIEPDFRIYMLELSARVDVARRKNETAGLNRLVKHAFGPETSLIYDEFGKPWPSCSTTAISVTHSLERVAIIVSDVFLPGIDIEVERPELEKTITRVMHPSELDFLEGHPDRQWVLQVIWGAKESVYKSYGKKKIVFREDIVVAPFGERPETELKLILKKNDQRWEYRLKAEYKDGFYLVYTTGCVMI